MRLQCWLQQAGVTNYCSAAAEPLSQVKRLLNIYNHLDVRSKDAKCMQASAGSAQ
jgi:hypothetical protein